MYSGHVEPASIIDQYRVEQAKTIYLDLADRYHASVQDLDLDDPWEQAQYEVIHTAWEELEDKLNQLERHWTLVENKIPDNLFNNFIIAAKNLVSLYPEYF